MIQKAFAPLLALSLLTLDAAAGDIQIHTSGSVVTVFAPGPPPFDDLAVDDSVRFTISVFDTPDTSVPGQATYPIDTANSYLTLQGITMQIPFSPLNSVVMFDDLENVGDRIAVTMGSPIGPGVLVVALDELSGTAWSTVDLKDLFGLAPQYVDGNGRAVVSGGGAGAQVWLDEARFVDESAVQVFCASDGQAALCPCANDATISQGCENSTGAGALLEASGSASLADDTFRLHAAQLPPASPCLLFMSQNDTGGSGGIPFGDGQRCVGNRAIRLQGQLSDTGGAASWSTILGSAPLQPGDTLLFQVWYADSAANCGAASVNMTPAVAVQVAL